MITVTRTRGIAATSAAPRLIVAMITSATTPYSRIPPPSSQESAQISVSRVSSWNLVIASDGLIGSLAAFGPPLTV